MSTATITKPKTKGKSKTPARKLSMATPKVTGKTTRGSNAPCENCEVKSKRKKPCGKKKKPMFKLGCWRGLLKGDLDL